MSTETFPSSLLEGRHEEVHPDCAESILDPTVTGLMQDPTRTGKGQGAGTRLRHGYKTMQTRRLSWPQTSSWSSHTLTFYRYELHRGLEAQIHPRAEITPHVQLFRCPHTATSPALNQRGDCPGLNICKVLRKSLEGKSRVLL